MKRLFINIRGACASGKTTAVKKYMKMTEGHAEEIYFEGTPFPITINNKGVIAIGDYTKEQPKVPDSFVDGEKKSESIDLAIKRCVEVMKHAPRAVLYEKMLFSQGYGITKRLAKAAEENGYVFVGLELDISTSQRLTRLHKRSKNPGLKSFIISEKNEARTYEKLKSTGYIMAKIDAVQPWSDISAVINMLEKGDI